MPYTGRLEATPLLDVIQIVAYTQRSGLLSVKGADKKGLLIFKGGNIVCAYSPSALPLLVKAAKETDPEGRLSLRQVQVLSALRELFEIGEGDYRFIKQDEPVAELEGLDIKSFYETGALDTGDLLLVLEKAMDEDGPEVSEVSTEEYDKIEDPTEAREHPRYGPFIIKAELVLSHGTLAGYLTNLSKGGTFFHADELPEPGTMCRVRFELPWELGQCQAKAKVVWQRSKGPDTKKGVGLSFLEFSPDSKRKVNAYLDRFSELAADVDFEA